MLCEHRGVPYSSSVSRQPVSVPGRVVCAVLAIWLAGAATAFAAGPLPTPEQFTGFRVGADNKLVRWDQIADYMKLVAASSDRVRLRDLGRTTGGNALLALEISSADTIRNLDRYKQLERRLYFQGGAPTPRERDDIFRRGKLVVLVTCSVHPSEVGPTQMSLDLVYHLATDNSPDTRQILDNVILVLVPSLNPDGQMLVTDWFNRNLGTPYEGSPLPMLPHTYVGHDNNRDMYMLTQKESQYMATLAWHDWFPAVWLDEHQMGSAGPRIFVMPAADPVNPNVHPLMYRWSSILGQAQGAALEAAGKQGIIHGWTYTNFWEGAMAWTGWWHNQIALLTEVASARVASPIEQRRVGVRGPAATDSPFDIGVLPPPTDITPRTDYLRPWMGGRWTLGDVVDYHRVATLGLLDAVSSLRETILRQVYEANRQTVETGPSADLSAIVVPLGDQQDVREVGHLMERLQMGGVEVYSAQTPFAAGRRQYAAGDFVIPMNQVFARYAKDVLEKQAYPELGPGAGSAIEPPYDVTAWSLGMLLGVRVDFLRTPLAASLKLTRVSGAPGLPPAHAVEAADAFVFDYTGPDTAIAINRLLKRGAGVAFDGPSRIAVTNVPLDEMRRVAEETGLSLAAANPVRSRAARLPLHAPRIALYAPWTGGNVDEGWTRWVLEQYEFDVTSVHNAEVRAGGLHRKFDVLILPDASPGDITEGFDAPVIRPEYRGGIGEDGLQSLERFVADGGTLVALGTASNLVVDRFKLRNVRDEKRNLRRDQHFGPGSILHIDVDTTDPLGYGMAAQTYGFYDNGPFFSISNEPGLPLATSIARYPSLDVLASGWLKGEELMAGKAGVVSIDTAPGRIVLFGLRPQHRAQTHATFPMLFNALYRSAADAGPGMLTQ